MNVNQALDRLKGGDAEQQAIAAAIDAEIERLQRLLVRSTDDGQQLLDAVAGLLACPAIADVDHADPQWGCVETWEAEAFARSVLKKEDKS